MEINLGFKGLNILRLKKKRSQMCKSAPDGDYKSCWFAWYDTT